MTEAFEPGACYRSEKTGRVGVGVSATWLMVEGELKKSIPQNWRELRGYSMDELCGEWGITLSEFDKEVNPVLLASIGLAPKSDEPSDWAHQQDNDDWYARRRARNGARGLPL